MQGAHDRPATSLSGQPGQSLWRFDSRIRKKERRREGQGGQGEAWGIVLRSVEKDGATAVRQGESRREETGSEAVL